jgi:hypothetical protein
MSRVELGITVGIVFAMLLLNIIYMTYLMFYKLETAEHYLIKSDWIRNNKANLKKTGWIGAIYRLNAIAIVLLMPKLSQKRKLISLPEVQAFPKNIKIMILSNYFFLILLLLCLMTLVTLSKI